MKDLHLHASGSASPRILYSLIRESGLKTKAKTYWEFEKLVTMDRSKIENLDDYVSVLHDIDKIQSSPLALELCFYEAYVDSYLAGTTFLELRFNPAKRSLDNQLDLDSLIIAARRGKEKACNYFGIDGTLCLCMGRDMSEAANYAVFNKALQYKGKGVSTIDIAGSEKIKLEPYFEDIYKDAKRHGLALTCHAAETKRDLDETREELEFVIDKLNVDRIGHGKEIVHFPDLMKLASSKGILFEICISSNLTSRAVASLEEYKEIFKKFEEYNLRYILCTDATHQVGTTLAKEYELYNTIRSI